MRVMEEGKSFKTAQKKFSQGHFHLTGIHPCNGESTTNQDRIVESTREFYKEICSCNLNQDNQAVNNETRSDTEECPPILGREVEDAINSSKKARHLDQITL